MKYLKKDFNFNLILEFYFNLELLNLQLLKNKINKNGIKFFF